MNCPDCDTPMSRAGNRPHFHCRHCSQFHFPEETGDGVTVLGEPTGALCPVCHVALQSAEIEGETVCYCDRCRGFLSPLDTFARIVAVRRSRQRPLDAPSEPFDPAELERRLECPNCHERMDTHPYFGGGNSVVDTCEACQLLWLDAGELAIIGRYVPRARRAEDVILFRP